VRLSIENTFIRSIDLIEEWKNCDKKKIRVLQNAQILSITGSVIIVYYIQKSDNFLGHIMLACRMLIV
jgi:hypothetical protein